MKLWQIALLAIGAVPTAAIAQQPSPDSQVLTWTEGVVSPPATIHDAEWLVGDWRGTLEGNMQESMIFEPTKGHVPGFARGWGQDGGIGFYEINDVVEVDGSLEYHVKHFSGDLVAREAKDGYVRHRLIKITKGAIYFDGLTIVKEGRNHFTVYVLLEGPGQKGHIAVVHQSRNKID